MLSLKIHKEERNMKQRRFTKAEVKPLTLQTTVTECIMWVWVAVLKEQQGRKRGWKRKKQTDGFIVYGCRSDKQDVREYDWGCGVLGVRVCVTLCVSNGGRVVVGWPEFFRARKCCLLTARCTPVVWTLTKNAAVKISYGVPVGVCGWACGCVVTSASPCTQLDEGEASEGRVAGHGVHGGAAGLCGFLQVWMVTGPTVSLVQSAACQRLDADGGGERLSGWAGAKKKKKPREGRKEKNKW